MNECATTFGNGEHVMTFKRGIQVFWEKELRNIVIRLSQAIMAVALFLLIGWLFKGFWLFQGNLPAPWEIVWLIEASPVLWISFLFFLVWRHIVRLGKEEIHFGNRHGDDGGPDVGAA
jgi:hypothetical protein